MKNEIKKITKEECKIDWNKSAQTKGSVDDLKKVSQAIMILQNRNIRTLDELNEILKPIDETRKLIKADEKKIKRLKQHVSKIEDYEKLKLSGENTAETVEKLKEQIPEYVDKIKELVAQTDADTLEKTNLELYAEQLQALADSEQWDKVSNKIKQIDEDFGLYMAEENTKNLKLFLKPQPNCIKLS